MSVPSVTQGSISVKTSVNIPAGRVRPWPDSRRLGVRSLSGRSDVPGGLEHEQQREHAAGEEEQREELLGEGGSGTAAGKKKELREEQLGDEERDGEDHVLEQLVLEVLNVVLVDVVVFALLSAFPFCVSLELFSPADCLIQVLWGEFLAG